MFDKLTLLTIAVITLTQGASASTIVFNNQSAHPSGTLTFGTGSGAVSLFNGVVDQVSGIAASVTSFPVLGTCGSGLYGCLNFTTGQFLDSSMSGDTVTYRYAAGGAVSITGTADGVTGVLFSNMGFAAPVTLNYNIRSGLTSISGSLASGALSTALALSLGVEAGMLGGTQTDSAFNIAFVAGDGIGSVTTNSIQILAADVGTPEPAAVVMLGAGLLAIGV